MQQKTYDSYKDSGIEWIGKIPKEWKVKKIKQISNYEIGGTPPRGKQEYFEGDKLWVSIADLNDKKLIDDTYEKLTTKGIEDSNCKLIPRGSLLFSFKLSVGLLAFAGKDLYTNEAIASFLIGSKANLKYLYYALQTEFVNNARENIYGAKMFNQRTINDAKIQYPTFSEQEKIASFLDDKTSKIERIILNKNKQVELLKEYEKVLVNEAVIRGLNKSVQLKDSEIEWIGKIPEDWTTKRTKYISDLKFSNVDKKSEAEEKEVFACNYIDVYKNNYITNNLNFMKITATEDEIKRFSIRKGDILATKDSEEPEDIAIPSFVLEDFSEVVCGYHLAMIRPSNKIIPKYLFRLFQSRDFNIRFTIFAKGVTRFGLDMNIFKDAMVPLPPKDEQQQIADYLDEKTSKIRKSIGLIEKEVERLEEYKKILINEAVTGKIKIF